MSDIYNTVMSRAVVVWRDMGGRYTQQNWLTFPDGLLVRTYAACFDLNAALFHTI